MGRDFQKRIFQLTINLEQGVQRHLVLLVDQIGLVQQQQRANAGMLGGHQIAVDQIGVGFGQRGEDDDDLIDVGCHRLELAAHVGATQFAVSRQLRDDHAIALIAGAPDHLITGDQCRQVGAQVAAKHLAGQLALQALDFHLNAEVGDDQAGLLRPQIAAFEGFHGLRFTFGSAGSAFALNLSMRQFWRRLSWRLAMKHPGVVECWSRRV